MLDLTGLRERAGDQVAHALRRQPPAREHRDRPARRAGGAAARRAERGARPAPARAPVGVHPAPGRRGHHGRLRHAQHPGGRAPRRPLVVLADGELLFAGSPRELEQADGRRRASTSRRPSWRSCASGATDALAARQGPADPAPLAAAGGAAGALPDRDRRADRVRALARVRTSREVAFVNGLAGAASADRAGRAARSTWPRRDSACSRRSTRCRWTAARRRSRRCEDGEVLGALIIPEDLREAPVRARAGHGGGVLQRRGPGQGATSCENTIKSQVQDANAALTKRVAEEALAAPRPDLDGRRVHASSARTSTCSASSARSEILRGGAARTCPPGSPERATDRPGDRASPSSRARTSTSRTRCWRGRRADPGQGDGARRRNAPRSTRSPWRSRWRCR